MLEQAFNYVEEAIGGNVAANSSGASEAGDVLSYNCKVQPYSFGTFCFAGWMIQFTVHAYAVMYVLCMGGEKPRLGRINAAGVMLAYGLFTGGSSVNLTSDALTITSGGNEQFIPLSRIRGLDVKQGWITNLLVVHYADSAGKACKRTFWLLDPQELAQQIHSACAGAKGPS